MSQVMPQKLTQSDVIKKLMSAPDNEIVTFVFRSVGVFPPIVSSRILMKIRAPKSMLMKISPVFEAMFSANWDTNSVEMKDDVKFNQFDTFQLFLEVLFGLTSLSRYDSSVGNPCSECHPVSASSEKVSSVSTFMR